MKPPSADNEDSKLSRCSLRNFASNRTPLMQVLDAFKDCSLQTLVDGTLGAGGHSAALIRTHSEMHTLLGIDKDPAAHSIAEHTLHAAAEGRETPLDVRQIQACTCSAY